MIRAGQGNITWLCVAGVVCSSAAAPAMAQRKDPSRAARLRLVEEAVAGEGITNERVLDAMKTVRRHEFVPAKLRHRAYNDEALAIGGKQTISPPFIVAYMTQALDPQPGDRVLEIGTGSGYQAAVLAEIVSEVYSIEIVQSLARSAERRLKRLKYDNVHVLAGDGYKGWPEHAPFDHVIVTCSPESVPQPLVDQLKEGGSMIIPIGKRYQQSFYLLKKKNGELEQQRLISTLFVPMTGESEEQRRVQPDARNPQLVNGDFEKDTNNDGKADGWYYIRRAELKDSSPLRHSQCIEFEADEEGQLCQALQGRAISGRKIAFLNFSVWYQTENIQRGSRGERAGLIVHFYDAQRRELSHQPVTLWDNDMTWRQVRRRIAVPQRAQEMIVRVGLNGATGRAQVDGLSMTYTTR